MAIRRSHKLRNSRKLRRSSSLRAQRRGERGLRIENLEERRLLALGPQLMGVLPNAGSLLEEGDIRSIAPQELLFRFDEDQVLDAATFDACAGVAMQGDWTGTCEVLPDGRRVVRGDHRLNNGWRIEDYDQLRRFVMSAIEQLETATRNAHTGEGR